MEHLTREEVPATSGPMLDSKPSSFSAKRRSLVYPHHSGSKEIVPEVKRPVPGATPHLGHHVHHGSIHARTTLNTQSAAAVPQRPKVLAFHTEAAANGVPKPIPHSGIIPFGARLRILGKNAAASLVHNFKKGPPNSVPSVDNSQMVGLTNTEIASSVLLQMLMYFNLIYSVVWLPACLVSIALKPGVDLVRGALLLVFLIVEPGRLYIGYGGNLQEKVPFIAAFMLLTLFPALPVCLYFAIAQQDVEPYDKAMGTAMAVILLSEMIVAFRAMRQLIRSQTLKFYLEDYEEVREGLKKGLKVNSLRGDEGLQP